VTVLRNPFTKALWDARRSLLGWALGLAAVGAMYAGFYPSIKSPEMARAMEAYPKALKEALNMQDMTSATGYLSSTVFGILGPLLFVVFAISVGARAIAGDEEAGTLDLVLAHPVSRTRLLLARSAALVVSLLIVGAAILLVLSVVAKPAQLDIPVGNLTAAVTHLVLLGLCFGALALSVGAIAGKRATVLAVTAGIAVVAYFGNTVAPQIGLGWLQKVSPFYYYAAGEPLQNGIQYTDAAVLLSVAVVLIGGGVLAFNRRDIAV
jgi:ABC-2 type transport system permease protein